MKRQVKNIDRCKLQEYDCRAVRIRVRELEGELVALKEEAAAPLPLLLHCPLCGARHIDAGRFALQPHKTHACQQCGHLWQPSLRATVGVRYLPGCKNEGGEAETIELAAKRSSM